MADRLLVSIIIPTFRNPDTLSQTLLSLTRLDYPSDGYEIVVVDDGDDDKTAVTVARLATGAPAILYVGQRHAGAASARNHGARLSNGEVLIFVDDDMLVPRDLILRHIEALDTHAPAVISGYREFAPELAERLRVTPFGRFRLVVESRQEWGDEHEWALSGHDLFRTHPEGLPANDLAVRKADFDRLGGFDETFPYAGYEDQEFTLRADEAGFACLVNHGLLAWHNDRRLTLRQFGERQRRGATTAVLLASKYPERYLHRPLFQQNGPVRSSDPLRLIAKKLAKRALTTRLGLAALFTVVVALERLAPRSDLLQRVYTAIAGVYIYAGVREGRKRYLSR